MPKNSDVGAAEAHEVKLKGRAMMKRGAWNMIWTTAAQDATQTVTVEDLQWLGLA